MLSAIKLARAPGAKILSIANVPTSSLARSADVSLGINSCPEIGVAATKSFTGQVSLAYAIIDRISWGRVGFDRDFVSVKITKTLAGSAGIERLLNITIPKVNDIYLLGRSLHFSIALEGALNMKELAYVHAEGIAASELIHGPLAPMDKNAVVFVLNPDDKTFSDTLSTAQEVKARGAKITGIASVPNDIYDTMIEIPRMDNELLYPLVEIIPLQLFSCYLTLHNNADPDFPRNLAKFVTVS